MKKKKETLRGYLPLLVMAALALTLGILLLCRVVTIDSMLALTRENPWETVAVILALYALKGCSAVIIYDVLILAVAALYPTREAVLLNAVGLVICLSVSFLIGRCTSAEKLDETIDRHPKFEKYFRGAQDAGFVFCFAVHTLNLSLEVQGVLMGLMRIPYWKYLAGSFLAVVPGMLCFTIAGSQLSLRSPLFWVILAVNVSMIAVGVWYTRKKIVLRAREDAETQPPRGEPSGAGAPRQPDEGEG